MAGTEPARHPVVVVAGPTASGKSGLAIEIAQAMDGVVINADSMQVYRDLCVLTARPSDAELARAPHRLFGVLDGADICSAGRWRALAEAEIRDAIGQGRLPILAGGSGLYLGAMLSGLSEVPPVAPEMVAAVQQRMDRDGPAAFHAALTEADPEMAARLRPSDRQRMVRAMSVLQATGRSLAHWQATVAPPPPDLVFHTLLLMPPRADLYARCDRRFTAMLKQGAMAEVEALLARRLAPSCPVMKAIGVAELAGAIAGDCSLEDAAAAAQQATRNYAKRQCTWFRHQIIAEEIIDAQFLESRMQENFSKIRHFVLTHRN